MSDKRPLPAGWIGYMAGGVMADLPDGLLWVSAAGDIEVNIADYGEAALISQDEARSAATRFIEAVEIAQAGERIMMPNPKRYSGHEARCKTCNYHVTEDHCPMATCPGGKPLWVDK